MNSVKEILHRSNLKGTSTRVAILNAIIGSQTPLSEPDIKERIHEVDRVTFYRSIKSLLDANIIQGIITRGKIIKYRYSNEDKENEPKVKFYCTECERMMDVEIKTEELNLPNDYKESAYSITITGTCKLCFGEDKKK